MDMGIQRFFFAIDGPRNLDDLQEQKTLLSKIESCFLEHSGVPRVSQLSKNRGIFVNVITALDWFFEENSFGIILEDDTVPDLSFGDFVRYHQHTIQESPKTLIISGWRGLHSVKNLSLQSESCSYPLIWGWATTREKWSIMRKWFFQDS
jgi:hypothetical protein